jgi:hypothetical protein
VYTSFSKAAGYSDGQWCGGAFGLDRKAVAGSKPSADSCAKAVAGDADCSTVFYLGLSSNGHICRCVMKNKKCLVVDSANDGYHNTIYRLQKRADQHTLPEQLGVVAIDVTSAWVVMKVGEVYRRPLTYP